MSPARDPRAGQPDRISDIRPAGYGPRDTDFRAAGVRIKNLADEEHPALEDFSRIGGKIDIDSLILLDQ